MKKRLIFVGISSVVAACGSDDAVNGQGDVRVQLTAEASITQGIGVGAQPEDARDYAVSYEKYLAVVGHVRLADGDRERADDGHFLLDMHLVGEEGTTLLTLDDVPAGRWTDVGFETPAAEPGVKVLDGVSADDAAEMIAQGYTYWIEGTVERPDAEGGPVRFEIKTDAPTVYSGCELDGQPGLAVKADATTTLTFTLHGDHLWFDGFPVGEESKISRRSAWITQVEDLDQDGVIDTEDLAAADPSVILVGYDLSGNPGGPEHPIDSVLEFARQQLATQGHYKGEGECAWNFEGVEARDFAREPNSTGDHDH